MRQTLSRLLILLACAGLPGCRAPWGKSDALQGAIAREDYLYHAGTPGNMGMNDLWNKDPTPVLKAVPLGTPVEKAEAVMKKNGFDCTETADEQGPILLCRATRESSWMFKEEISVRMRCREGKVADVTVQSHPEGP
jgi:hypothetical protein